MANRYNRIGATEEERADLRNRAYQRRLEGATYSDIAKELGVSAPTVKTLCQEYIDHITLPQAEQYRKIEADKLSIAEQVAWKILRDNHITIQHGKVVMLNDEPIADPEPVFKAIATVLKISERRAKLLGLDMPVKTETEVKVSTPIDQSVEAMLREMEQRKAAEREALGQE
jgi:transposase-like protein